MAPKPPKTLVIVESPTKAKTLKKFLGKDYIVTACMGHVRDLPQSAKDIPEKYKKFAWSKIGVDVDNDFKPLYLVPKQKTKIVSDLKKMLEESDQVLLATDEDREGESISWHLVELLKPTVPYKRMVFHEITKEAIKKAAEDTREIDHKLVKAQETRRVLDRLVGYTLSPLIWSKIAFGLSAGRVQSVAVELIVIRERERLAFISAKYCGLDAMVGKSEAHFGARLHEWGGVRIATGKDFDETTGALAEGKKVRVLTPADADALKTKLEKTPWVIEKIEEKAQKRSPGPPFITSTLQQEANRKLGWSARDTMRVAQGLYERGFITYMRTDSTQLSTEAIAAARASIEQKYGREYLSPEPRQYKSKSAGAQEAHEAIRPAGTAFQAPDESGLTDRELTLYDLIWKRTMATQMAEAEQLRTSVLIAAGDATFTANGLQIVFPGYLRAYVEGSDDPQAALDDRETVLPPLKEGETLRLESLERTDHETKPPARYTEASLVQKMEKEGIGRPSTYASTIATIIDRGYVSKAGNALVPTFTAFAVNDLLEKHFPELVDMHFTAEMEESLDKIAHGDLDWLPYLKQFYLGPKGLRSQVEGAGKKIDGTDARTVKLGKISESFGIDIKIGKFGPYFVKPGAKTDDGDDVRGSIPESLAPSDLNEEKVQQLVEQAKHGPTSLGVDPASGQKVYLLSGRYGPYVQLGMPREEAPPPAPVETEVEEEKPIKGGKKKKKKKVKAVKPKKPVMIKPKITGLPKGLEPAQVTLEIALKLLQLPRTLGVHPQTQKEIKAGLGRFGPYVLHDGDFRSLKKEDDILTVQLERALELLAAPKGAGRGAKKVIKEVGKVKDTTIQLIEGKFGLYVSDGKKNATLRQGLTAETLTLEAALEMLAERSAKKSKRK
jgi:DNA topoisomerase-1